MYQKQRKKQGFLARVNSGIDSFVGIFSPRAEAVRRKWRAVNRFSAIKHRGAEKNRLRENWNPGGGSPDEDILLELADLRERTRDMVKNDATAAGIKNTMVTNVVGTGLLPQSRVKNKLLGITEEQAEEYQMMAEHGFRKWAEHSDSRNRLPFWLQTHQIEGQIIDNGDVFVVFIRNTKDAFRTPDIALEVIEADRVTTPAELIHDKTIREGVKLGPRGQPMGYWVRKTHPGDMALALPGTHGSDISNFFFVDANDAEGRPNILHLYWQLRPGQTRGVPLFTPVLAALKDNADYFEAAIVKQRIQACIALFIETPDPDRMLDGNSTGDTDGEGRKIENMEPGMIDYLLPGETIKPFNPSQAGSEFDVFVTRMIRQISTAVNLPYELVAKDFSKTNYSSMRAALLEARRLFRVRQKFLIDMFCQPTWRLVNEELFLRNQLPAFVNDSYFTKKFEWTEARWIGQGWQWVDPAKEVKASREAVESSLSTLTDELASQGREVDDVLEEEARIMRKRQSLGLNPVEPMRAEEPDVPAQVEDAVEETVDDN